MPRWKALPEEMDPWIREFTDELRRLVDHSGLSVGAIADRTGYGETSWEHCLAGRLLPPHSAVRTLAEATGADVRHLEARWEQAKRAWSRAGALHSGTVGAAEAAGTVGTVETVRARAAFGAEEAPPEEDAERTTVLRVPRDLRAAEPERPGPAAPDRPSHGHPPVGGPVAEGPSDRRRPVAALLVGALSTLVLVANAAFVLSQREDGEYVADPPASSPTPEPTPESAPSSVPSPGEEGRSEPPAGVECLGDDCTGQDPKIMGCGGGNVTTVAEAVVGEARVEVRYSEVCRAAWARITGAASGDTVRITAAGATERDTVGESGETFTPMVAVEPSEAPSACVTTAAGVEGCTTASR